jgi:hypothetical protein
MERGPVTTTSQNKCDDTTGGNIQNTSGKAAKREVSAKFKLLDLHRLTFQLDGLDQVLDVETATAEQFNALAIAFADVEDVDTTVWPLEVRRDLINELWEFCLTEGYDFPLTEVADEAAQEGA